MTSQCVGFPRQKLCETREIWEHFKKRSGQVSHSKPEAPTPGPALRYMHAYIHTHIHTYICTYIHAFMDTHTCLHIYIRTACMETSLPMDGRTEARRPNFASKLVPFSRFPCPTNVIPELCAAMINFFHTYCPSPSLRFVILDELLVLITH